MPNITAGNNDAESDSKMKYFLASLLNKKSQTKMKTGGTWFFYYYNYLYLELF